LNTLSEDVFGQPLPLQKLGQKTDLNNATFAVLLLLFFYP
jgi:hypothetical protein